MPSSRSASSTEDHTSIESNHREPKQVKELLETAKLEIGEAREENKRLKRKLAQMEKDYRSMQVQFFGILRQEGSSRRSTDDSLEEDMKESGLVSLRLGMNPVSESEEEEKQAKEHSPKVVDAEDEERLDTKLQLSAEVKASLSTSPRLEERKDEEETWPPNKIQKTSSGEHDDDASPQTQAKRTRVSVRARCDSPTMNDGCQWRKYGQKISKGNPCPRAYYRCTVSPGCPVRKQVQRCVDDMSILTTTYEGTHNHPLPVSATAMASTTSAAATMLLSGSSTSTRPPATIPGFNGLNFSIYDNNNNSRNRFYMPNTPSPTLHPTITLDLTTPPPSTSIFPPHNRFNYSMPPPGFPPLNTFNFSASGQGAAVLPPPWSSYTSRQNPTFHSYLAPNPSSSSSSSQQQSLTETLTKALTTDPSFQSVIAAALSSMVAPNINGSGR